ncbi:MAG: ATPase [Sphingomonas sp.]|nr:ATPase [Sphingomonas sp.]
MKRFWKAVTAEPIEDGFAIRLDDRAVKTPSRNDLIVPTQSLSNAIVAEWESVEESLNPAEMPMTGLANAAIDRVAPAREAFAYGLAAYGEDEMCCYRADGPAELATKQAVTWDALIDWAARRYDISFETTVGIMHVEQPKATLEQLRAAVVAEDAFTLAGLSPLVSAGQSLLVALAVRHGALTPEQGWAATRIEEEWQIAQWGEDEEARKSSAARKADFLAGARFLDLLD